MTTLLGLLLGVMVTGGVVLLGLELHAPAPAEHSDPLPASRSRRRVRVPTGRLRDAVVGLLAGGVLAGLTGIVVLATIGAVLGGCVPPLFRKPPSARELERSMAVEGWTRGLAGMLSGGVGLEEALRSSLPSTPAPIRPEVARLVGRMQAQLPTQAAVRLWAQEMDDRTGDLVAAALIMGADTRRGGLSQALSDLCASVTAHTRTLQRIEADRAGIRTATRVITGMTAGLFTFVILGPYGQAYQEGLGQLVLLLLGVAYAGIVHWMYVLGRGRPAPRFLTAQVTR